MDHLNECVDEKFRGQKVHIRDIRLAVLSCSQTTTSKSMKISSQGSLPAYGMPSSLSIVIIGGAYGGTLGRAENWDDFAAGSETLSWK